MQRQGNEQSPLVFDNIKAPKNGYCYVYVSNEANEMVYFDNLQVSHERGRIVEENHYYSYGLKITGISSKKLGDVNEGQLKNGYLYNDKELFDDADLNWYDYGFRNYDPQIGRFTQLDPLTDDYPYYTPYQYAGCEPIANIDIDGLEPWSAIGTGVSRVQTLSEVVVTASRPAKTVMVGAVGGLQIAKSSLTGINLLSNNPTPISTPVIHNEQSPVTKQLNDRVRAFIFTPAVENDQPSISVPKEPSPGQKARNAVLQKNADEKRRIANHWTNKPNKYFDNFSERLAIPIISFLPWGRILKFGMTVKAIRGVAVIGPRATYRQFAKNIGARYLTVIDEAWSWSKNRRFLAGVVRRGDDVIFGGKFDPAALDLKSVLAREIKYLTERGYEWTDDFSKLIKK